MLEFSYTSSMYIFIAVILNNERTTMKIDGDRIFNLNRMQQLAVF